MNQKTPPIRELTFNFWIDSLPAPDKEVILEWRCDDPVRPLHCRPKDNGGLADGYTQYFGMFQKNTRICLNVGGAEMLWVIPRNAKIVDEIRDVSEGALDIPDNAEVSLSPNAGELSSPESEYRIICRKEVCFNITTNMKVRTKKPG